MSDATPQPVIAILGYANPIASQPANGKLQVSYDNDGGVTFTEVTAATMISPKVARFIGPLLVFIGLGLVIFWLPTRQTNRSLDPNNFVASIIVFVCGLFAFVAAKVMKPKPRIVEIRRGKIHTPVFRRRGIGGKIVISSGSIDLRSGKKVHNLCIHHFIWQTVILFQYLSHDEAVWAKNIMEVAREKRAVV